MGTVYPEFTTHLTMFFDDSLCGLKKLDKRDLTYNLGKVTCTDCLEKSRQEAIDNQKALDTLPHCPHCDGKIEHVTLTFTVTVSHRFDVQTERDYETQTIKPMVYSSHFDRLDSELVPDKEYQVICENGHEYFTKKLEPSDDLTMENGGQWYLKDVPMEQIEEYRICSVCGCDRSEHNWEAHTAEMKAGY
jgi:hypothetical protein